MLEALCSFIVGCRHHFLTLTVPLTVPQRQTVPVAPRTRLASSEEMTAAIQLVQEHLHSLAPRVRTYASAELPPSRSLGMYKAEPVYNISKARITVNTLPVY